MNAQQSIGIIGTGYAIPETIRLNDDPIFQWLRDNNPSGMDLFAGYNERRCLAPDQSLIDIMLPAAQQAIQNAGLRVEDIDALFGYASVCEYIMPNALAQLHHALGLSQSILCVPLNDEFTNLNSGLMISNALIQTGQIRNALIVCAGNWTRYVSYQTPQSISASDGAGAVVIGLLQRDDQFAFVDAETEIQSQYYGAMYMLPDAIVIPPAPNTDDYETAYTDPYFHITPEGAKMFVDFGENTPPLVVKRLLERNQVEPGQITLISHQASSVLMDAWRTAIQPGDYISTLDTYANMTLATIAVNLASREAQIKTEYLVLLGIGAHPQTTATLLKRTQ